MRPAFSRLPGYSVFFLVILLFTSCSDNKSETIRKTALFNSEWRFILDDGFLCDPLEDDENWRILNLPHDWSIEGTFDEENPATFSGGALPGGIGWYRKHFFMPESDSAKRTFITFDGVYRNSKVFLNGVLLGTRPNGYISFTYDLTPFLRYGEKENVIAVRVDNSEQPNSRWYSGSGIYRNVWLTTVSRTRIAFNETFVSTPEVGDDKATIQVQSQLVVEDNTAELLEAVLTISDPKGKKVAGDKLRFNPDQGSRLAIDQSLIVADPVRWSVADPSLYTLEIMLYADGKKIDSESVRFGIRTFHFDPEKGFFLNNVPMKILGVCNHHDLGSLGAAVNIRYLERQLELLKDMGCNAIRTSHNPPAPELLDLCDEMGFLVMDEAFDMWKIGKNPYDYHLNWDEWHARDLEDLVKRDRNHASVFMWSIGNEIKEQWDSSGIAITTELYNIVRSLDTTREIITGNDSPYPGNFLLQAGVMDMVGFNYRQHKFVDFPENFPGKCFLATEACSGLMTRGYYEMPSDSIRRWPEHWSKPFTGGNAEHYVSAYDNVSAPWGSTHEESWSLIKKYDYLSGMFIWTGFDYLGEPTPYGWPSRSSYFGILDLAGFPKDVYYMYQSEWTDTPVLHIFPHWNWKSGEEVDVLAYTNCDEVELFLNGRSMGRRTNADSIFHLSWRLEFEPGELLAIGVLPNGDTLRTTVRTAGEPVGLKVEADRTKIKADGYDLSFVTVSVVDENGIMVPDAMNKISCEVSGAGRLVATDNGYQASLESFRTNFRKAFNGKCLFIIQADENPGPVHLEFTSPGLGGEQVELTVI